MLELLCKEEVWEWNLPLTRPKAMPEPVPTRAGKVLRLAATSSPPFPGLGCLVLKSKTKSSSLERIVKRSAALTVLVESHQWVLVGGCLRIGKLKLGSQTERLGSLNIARSSLSERSESQDGRDGSNGELHCDGSCYKCEFV